jgi:hypothetical protein
VDEVVTFYVSRTLVILIFPWFPPVWTSYRGNKFSVAPRFSEGYDAARSHELYEIPAHCRADLARTELASYTLNVHLDNFPTSDGVLLRFFFSITGTTMQLTNYLTQVVYLSSKLDEKGKLMCRNMKPYN